MTEDRKEAFEKAVSAAADHYDADIFLYSGAIEHEGYGRLIEEMADHKSSRDRAILILTTHGGSANVAYQIARLFQKTYTDFIVFAPSICKSAGTLIALGAHELLLDNMCDLGPLDVQLFKQNEIAERKSGLLSKSSFDALGNAAFHLYEKLMMGITMRSGGVVNFKLASELSASMTGQLLSQVYSQMNPDIVGSENRDLNIALEYGRRLVGYSQNSDEIGVMRLVEDYPSHDFIIDNDECETLFNNVDVPSEHLYQVLRFIKQYVYDEASNVVVLGLTPSVQGKNADERNQSDDPAAQDAPSRGERKSVDGDRPPDRSGHSEPPSGPPQRGAPGDGQVRKPPDGNAGSAVAPEGKEAAIKVVK